MQFSQGSDSDKDSVVEHIEVREGGRGIENSALLKQRSEALASRALSNRQRFAIEQVKSELIPNFPSFPSGVAEYSSSIPSVSVPIAVRCLFVCGVCSCCCTTTRAMYM